MPNLIVPTTPRALKTVHVATAAAGRADGSTAADPMLLADAVAAIADNSLFTQRSGTGVTKILLTPGTYSLTSALSLFDHRPKNQLLEFEGTGAAPADTIVEGSSSAAFRIYRSNVSFNNLAIKNPDGDAIAAWGAQIYLGDVAFGQTFFDLIAADEGTSVNIFGALSVFENCDPDTFVRLSHGSVVRADGASIDFGGFTCHFWYAVMVANPASAFICSSTFPITNDQNVTGQGFERNKGLIAINNHAFQALNGLLPGEVGYFDAYNDDPAILKPTDTDSNQAVKRFVTVPRRVGFNLPTGTAVSIPMDQEAHELLNFSGMMGITAFSGGDSMSAQVRLSAIIENSQQAVDPGNWLLKYNWEYNAQGTTFSAFGLTWYVSGTLNGSNGTVDRLNFSYNANTLYLGNRNPFDLQITLELLCAYNETGTALS